MAEDFNLTGINGLAPVDQIFDNVMTQGVGFPLRPVSYDSGTAYGGPSLVLDAGETLDQVPAGISIPLQLTFGAAQFGPGDPVQLSAAGEITFNQSGSYSAIANFYLGRLANPGTVAMLIRALVDGAQYGDPVAVFVSNNQELQFEQLQYTADAAFGEVLTFEIMRDAQGNDDGGLNAVTTEWGVAPSALIRIQKF